MTEIPSRPSHLPKGSNPAEHTQLWVDRLTGRRQGIHPASILLLLGMAGAGTMFGYDANRLWFFGDDWDFLFDRGVTHRTQHNLLRPHNEHWSTLPILAYRLLYTLVGVRHYLPYGSMTILAHLVVTWMTYVLLRRMQTSEWLAAGGAFVIAFVGAGAENILWDFQIGFVGSVMFGLTAIYCFDRHADGHAPIWWTWAAAIAALMCSGMALPMIGALCAYALLRSGLKRALLTGAIPGIVYLAWYETYGHLAHHPTGSYAPSWSHRVEYLWTGLRNIWGTMVDRAGAGGWIIVVLGVSALLVRSTPKLKLLAISTLAGLVAEYALTGYFRVQLGLGEAKASRYLYVGAVLSVPAMVHLADGVRRVLDRTRWSTVAMRGGAMVGAVAVTGLVWHGITLTSQFRRSRSNIVLASKARIIGGAVLVREGVQTISLRPDPQFSPQVTVMILAEPEIRHEFLSIPSSAQDLLEGAGGLQVGVGTKPFPVPYAATLGLIRTTGRPLASGCTTLSAGVATSALVIPAGPRGGQFELLTPPLHVQTYLTEGTMTSHATTWYPTNGRPVFIATSAAGASLRVVIGALGKVTACLDDGLAGTTGPG